MTLRLRLTLALTLAALLPMAVVVGVPMLGAEERAKEEADERLSHARHQAEVLLGRHRKETADRVGQAAVALDRDRAGIASLLEGPETAARATTRGLAERHGLDELDILDGDGDVIARYPVEEGAGLKSPLVDLAEGRVELRPLASPAPGSEARVAFYSRRRVSAGRETLSLAGGRLLGDDLLSWISEITGEPTALVDPADRIAACPAGTSALQGRISDDLDLEGGWKIRVSARPGDAARVRRELLAAFWRVAPIALPSALVVGVLLAQGISRPIRALAARADRISAERAAPLSLPPERDELRSLEVSFDRMVEALVESERQRLSAERVAAWEEVARRIAHEVKNPLSPIRMAVENLRRTREKAPEELDRALELETATILEEVESLRRLVDEFSQFARLPKLEPVPCDIRQVVSHALALVAPRIETLGVRLEHRVGETPSRVVADPEQIGRAVKNVLSNALDALEPVADRRLAVSVREAPARRRGGGTEVEIEVRDTGVGLAPEALRRIFEPYYTTRAEHGGSGLGMAIAYRIAAEHGGEIRAAGAPGKGAVITIRLPVKGPTDRA